MKRHLFLSILLVLSLSLLLFTACDNDKDKDLDTVWKDYANDHFSFEYPGSWFIVEEDEYFESIFVTVADDKDEEEKTRFFFVAFDTEEGELTEDGWEEMKTFFSEEFEITFTETQVDGKPAYTGEGQREVDDRDVRFILVFIYENQTVHEMMYMTQKDSFNRDLGDRMISSFSFK